MFITKSLPEHGRGLDRETVKALLPKVGDVRQEVPTLTNRQTTGDPEECVVIEVHPDHLYYRVRFTGSGFIECYKVPKTRRLAWEVEPCNIQK
jgi:hypothetical protein